MSWYVQGTCDSVPADSPAEQLYCTPHEPPACLYNEKSSWCTDTSLSDCHILQPLNNGDRKNPQNLISRLSSATATEVGFYYGPQAICIGVPNGELSRGFRTWPIDDACVASRCEDDGSLSVLIKEVASSDFKAFPCPEGQDISLGVTDGIAPDVRPLLRLPRSEHTCSGSVRICLDALCCVDNGLSGHELRGWEWVQTKLGPCPAASDVCPYKGCPVNLDLMCSLQGNCFDNKCFCAVDKSGDDCSQTLCDSDEGCLDGQFCSDSHECTWSFAPSPPPPGTGTETLVVCTSFFLHCRARNCQSRHTSMWGPTRVFKVATTEEQTCV